MTDLKRRLDLAGQHYGSDPDAFERLERRRARKHRNERLTGATAGLAAAVVAVVILIRAFGGSGAVPSSAPGLNGELMYSKNVESGWSLFAVDPVSGTERQVTHGYRDYDNAWSPDGQRIIYSSEDPETNDETLFIANPDGSGARNLGIEGGSPSWSADGSYIVYQGPLGAIWTSLPDGSQAEQLTIPPPGSGTERPNDFHPIWSPDGRTLAFVRTNPEAGRDELRVLTDSGEETLVTTGDPDGYIGALDWSPDGQRITFASVLKAPEDAAAATNSHIFVVPATGGEPTQLTENLDGRGWNTYPTWSPDGTKIAYVDDSRGKIVIMNPDGTDKHDLPVRPGNDSIVYLNWGTHPGETVPAPDSAEPSPQAATHPGAARLVLEKMVDQERHIYLGDPEDGSLVELTRGTNDQGAIVSPDGTQIVYHGDRGLIVVNSDGSDKEVTSPRDHYYYPEAWSQDGTEILVTDYFGDNQDAFRWVNPVTRLVRDASFTSGGPADIAPDGRVAHVVLDEYRLHMWDPATDQDHLVIDRDATSVAWSPDGSRIAFTSEYDIWLVNPDGTDAVQLTHMKDGRTASSPRWSPDGTRIAYEQNGAIWMMDSDGSNRHVVLGGPDGYGLSDWADVSIASL